jgi:hypothetical protein
MGHFFTNGSVPVIIRLVLAFKLDSRFVICWDYLSRVVGEMLYPRFFPSSWSCAGPESASQGNFLPKLSPRRLPASPRDVYPKFAILELPRNVDTPTPIPRAFDHRTHTGSIHSYYPRAWPTAPHWRRWNVRDHRRESG